MIDYHLPMNSLARWQLNAAVKGFPLTVDAAFELYEMTGIEFDAWLAFVNPEVETLEFFEVDIEGHRLCQAHFWADEFTGTKALIATLMASGIEGHLLTGKEYQSATVTFENWAGAISWLRDLAEDQFYKAAFHFLEVEPLGNGLQITLHYRAPESSDQSPSIWDIDGDGTPDEISQPD